MIKLLLLCTTYFCVLQSPLTKKHEKILKLLLKKKELRSAAKKKVDSAAKKVDSTAKKVEKKKTPETKPAKKWLLWTKAKNISDVE